ncbi:molybdate ABC transporter substrate-binding protein [Variovorax sp. Root411]|uniref:molybdate ABC transporter substrate-binding protein n=1 Tax=Variovorax sp. Root411 TaxID=1736530 RepID=UPI0006FB45D5|nr:molybdate ABC transporter substrate-binding protein [Variovorax sp. Root411]KQW63613.1 molybdate ABC transporter substrate-binding protein [Variovorax sp. Root411]
MRPFHLLSLALALALPLAAGAQQITVSAAASLTDAFKEIGPRFEAARPGAVVRFNFAASGVLLQQIVQGAPVDVFASADQETMNRGAEQKAIDVATRKDFVTNSLVLIEPAKEGVGVKTLQDLGGASVKKIAIGKVATVPVGRYTRQVLDSAKLWTTLEPKFVQADSVRQVLDYVSRGEVEAGFVYRTDAAVAGDKVKIAFTPTGHAPVTYPIAVVSESKQKALAGDFIAFLSTPAAQEVLARYGFGKP